VFFLLGRHEARWGIVAYAATRGWFGVACGRDFRSRLASSPRLENA